MRILTTKTKTHVLAVQRETLAELASRAHPRLTQCGRSLHGYAGVQLRYFSSKPAPGDCKTCRKITTTKGFTR